MTFLHERDTFSVLTDHIITDHFKQVLRRFRIEKEMHIVRGKSYLFHIIDAISLTRV